MAEGGLPARRRTAVCACGYGRGMLCCLSRVSACSGVARGQAAHYVSGSAMPEPECRETELPPLREGELCRHRRLVNVTPTASGYYSRCQDRDMSGSHAVAP